MNGEIVQGAESQHGVITLARAAALAGRQAAAAELRSARWSPMAMNVYRIRGAPRTWEQRLMALVLAAGPSAAASHRSAAALLGISGFDRSGAPEVTTPRARRHRDPSTLVHRWRPFPDHHLTVVDGIPTTRVARTLVDLAGVLHPGRTERAVDSCLGARMLTVASLHATFAELAGRGRKGVAVMRAILAERPEGYVAPESELEVRFLAVLDAAGLPAPVRQLDTGGPDGWIGRADYAYRAEGVRMEVDGRTHHTAKLDRDADERRDAALRAGGWRHIERFTWADVMVEPGQTVARVRRHLHPNR
ncbi:MAG TPA: DUF559 domain-containing protein [Acidimicrobiales bacterium]|nr:DUF559 domain-containing protein [Acidimicrobiales bacterium]